MKYGYLSLKGRFDVKWIDCMRVWYDRVLVILDDGQMIAVFALK